MPTFWLTPLLSTLNTSASPCARVHVKWSVKFPRTGFLFTRPPPHNQKTYVFDNVKVLTRLALLDNLLARVEADGLEGVHELDAFARVERVEQGD